METANNETYMAMKERHQTEANALPLAFAFSRDQYREILAAWNITEEEAEAGAIIGIGAGGFIRSTDAELVFSTFKRISEEQNAAIAADDTGAGFIYQMFLYELNNHEYGYTGDTGDTLDALNISAEDLEKSAPLRNGLKLAMDKISRGAGPLD